MVDVSRQLLRNDWTIAIRLFRCPENLPIQFGRVHGHAAINLALESVHDLRPTLFPPHLRRGDCLNVVQRQRGGEFRVAIGFGLIVIRGVRRLRIAVRTSPERLMLSRSIMRRWSCSDGRRVGACCLPFLARTRNMENSCTEREPEEPLQGSSHQRAPPVLAVGPPRIAIIVSRNYCPAESRGSQNRLRTVKGLPKKSRQPSRDFFQSMDPLFS